MPEENPADDASEGGGVDRSEKVVIKMKVNSNASQGDWNEYYFIKYLEEEFNVDFQIEMISDEIWAEKLPLMFATNELPDLCKRLDRRQCHDIRGPGIPAAFGGIYH